MFVVLQTKNSCYSITTHIAICSKCLWWTRMSQHKQNACKIVYLRENTCTDWVIQKCKFNTLDKRILRKKKIPWSTKAGYLANQLLQKSFVVHWNFVFSKWRTLIFFSQILLDLVLLAWFHPPMKAKGPLVNHQVVVISILTWVIIANRRLKKLWGFDRNHFKSRKSVLTTC